PVRLSSSWWCYPHLRMMPSLRNLRPIRLSCRDEPFQSDQFIYELKVDGFRALLHIEGNQGLLVSRNGNEFHSFAELACAIAAQLVENAVPTDVEFAYRPHPAGPPVCWCRKPLPGLVLQFAFRHRLALDQCLLIGRSPADRTLAARIGMKYHSTATDSF